MFQNAASPAVTALDGSYEFSRVAPGTYTVAFDTLSPDATGRGPGRVYLPGVPAGERAGVVALTVSERGSAPDLVLPDAIRTVMLAGVVRETDGRALPGTRVYARSIALPTPWTSAPAITDESGRFLLTVVAGRQYSLFAELPTEGIRFRQGQAGPFDASSDAVLEIVLEPAPR